MVYTLSKSLYFLNCNTWSNLANNHYNFTNRIETHIVMYYGHQSNIRHILDTALTNFLNNNVSILISSKR